MIVFQTSCEYKKLTWYPNPSGLTIHVDDETDKSARIHIHIDRVRLMQLLRLCDLAALRSEWEREHSGNHPHQPLTTEGEKQ